MSISTFDLTEYDTEHGYGPEDTNDTPAPPPPATDPQGWVPKEPTTREEFEALMERYFTAVDASTAFLAAFNALAAERDAALKRCDKLEAYVRLDSLPPDPRIEAWRALDSFDAAQLLHRMRAEAGRRTGYNDDKGAAAWTAAAEALYALAEPRP